MDKDVQRASGLAVHGDTPAAGAAPLRGKAVFDVAAVTTVSAVALGSLGAMVGRFFGRLADEDYLKDAAGHFLLDEDNNKVRRIGRGETFGKWAGALFAGALGISAVVHHVRRAQQEAVVPPSAALADMPVHSSAAGSAQVLPSGVPLVAGVVPDKVVNDAKPQGMIAASDIAAATTVAAR